MSKTNTSVVLSPEGKPTLHLGRICKAYLTKSGLRVFGFCPAGSTSKQLSSDQLEDCLIGFVSDGQIVHP